MTCAPDSLCRAIIDSMPDAVRVVAVIYAVAFVGLWAFVGYENWKDRRKSK